MKIYLQKDESIFTKYGDEEAAYYEKMMLLEEEKKKKQKEEREKERKERPERQKNNRRQNDGQGYNDNISKEDAEKMGLNFRQGGPPKFKNDKKKTAPETSKEVREVIEVNTAKNNDK